MTVEAGDSTQRNVSYENDRTARFHGSRWSVSRRRVVRVPYSAVTAQNDQFGEITCTGLTVVDSDGNRMVRLTGQQGVDYVLISSPNKDGGGLVILGKEDNPLVRLGVVENNRLVTVNNKDASWRSDRRFKNSKELTYLGTQGNGGPLRSTEKQQIPPCPT